MAAETAPFLAAALDIARHGVRCVPLFHGLRYPTLSRWPELATSDPETLARLFDDVRTTGVGIVTGAESGVWSLDLDPAGFARLDALEQRHGRLPATSTVKTRRGLHLHFRHPAGVRIPCAAPCLNLGAGLDVKGAGGCVAAPPTPHAAGAYAWLRGLDERAEAPAWLLDRVVEKPRPTRRSRPSVDPSKRSRWAAAALAGERARVAGAAAGARAVTTFRAACALGQIVGAGDLDAGDVESALVDAALATGLEERRALTAVRRGVALGRRSPRRRVSG